MQQSRVGYLCTCARAHRVSVSQERLGRLGSILVCGLGFMNYVGASHKSWVEYARAHVHTALLYLRNGLTDCVQIWYVGWGSLSTCFPQVMGGVGHLCTCARATPPPSPYLRIRLNNCANIWCVVRDPIVTIFTKVGGGMTAHSHVRLQFVVSETAQPGHWSHTKNILISFGLARSSLNMASYWFIPYAVCSQGCE